jgi:protein O-mannosyl-transferase
MAQKRKVSPKKSGKKKGTQKRKTRRKITEITRKQILIALGIIVAVTFIAYSPILNAGFVDIDDEKLILSKGRMFLERPLEIYNAPFGPHYKPVTYTTWMLEYRAVGDKPFLYHFNNLLLHIINSLLVFFMIRQIAMRFKKLKPHEFQIAFFTALLFGLHPLHVESVSWVVERKDVLYTCFFLLSMSTYIRYLNQGKTLMLVLSAVTYILSVLSKSPGITLIAILFLLDFAWGRKLSAKLFIEKAGHFVLFIFSLYALGFFRSSGEGSLASITDEKVLAKSTNVRNLPIVYGKALLSSMRAWLWYIHSLFPFKTSIGYPREGLIGFFGPLIHIFPIMLAAAIGALIAFAKNNRLLFFAHAFFLVTLSPAVARLGLGIGIFMSDRYVYLPVLGLIFLIVSWVIALGDNKRLSEKMRYGILGIIAFVFAIMTFQGTQIWESTETLWSNVINKYPSVPYGHVNRGSYYRSIGEMDKALADITNGIAHDDNANARIQRGLIYRQTGRAAEALTDYNKALELEPDNTQALVNRGNAFLDNRQFQKAIADYDVVLGKFPSLRASVNRAIAYASLGQYGVAEQAFKEVEADAGNYKDFYMNRAILMVEMRKYPEALNDYSRYLQLVPDDHQIHNDKGVVLALMGRYAEAIQSYTTAISMSPVKDYFLSRARSYDANGEPQKAEQDRARAR